MPTPAPLPLLPDPLGVPLDDQPLDDGHRLDEGQSLDDGHRLDDQLPEPSLPNELHQEEPLHELPEDDHQLPEDDHHDEPDELHHDGPVRFQPSGRFTKRSSNTRGRAR